MKKICFAIVGLAVTASALAETCEDLLHIITGQGSAGETEYFLKDDTGNILFELSGAHYTLTWPHGTNIATIDRVLSGEHHVCVADKQVLDGQIIFRIKKQDQPDVSTRRLSDSQLSSTMFQLVFNQYKGEPQKQFYPKVGHYTKVGTRIRAKTLKSF